MALYVFLDIKMKCSILLDIGKVFISFLNLRVNPVAPCVNIIILVLYFKCP